MQPMYQELIRSEGMVQNLVRGLKMENQELQKHCASAIFKVAFSPPSPLSSLCVCVCVCVCVCGETCLSSAA